MPSLIEIGPMVLEKIFNILVFSLFHNYVPLEKGVIWANLNPIHLNALYRIRKISPVVQEKRIFKFRKGVFAIS